MKKLSVFLVALLMMVMMVMTACGQKATNTSADSDTASDWEAIETKGKIVIGIDDTFVPMGFRDEKDQLVGFDIDLAKAVTEELGIEPEFQPIDWSMKETELINGSIDLIWNGYTMTPERQEKVSFSNPYLKNEQVLVTLKKYNVTNYKDMNGKTLGAQEGSSGVDVLEAKPEILLDLVNGGEPVLYSVFSDAFMDLNAGRIEGLIIDSVFAEYYISREKNKDDYVVLPSQFDEEDYGIGVRKEDKVLLEKINQALAALVNNGKAKEISEKWFDENRVLSQPK